MVKTPYRLRGVRGHTLLATRQKRERREARLQQSNERAKYEASAMVSLT